MNVVLYIRVSSEKQAEKEIPIAGQLSALRAHAQAQGWKIVKEFVDGAESGRTAARSAFQEMIALAKQQHKEMSKDYLMRHASRSMRVALTRF